MPADMPFGPEEFAAKTNVSRETMALFESYASRLAAYNAHTNLVSKSSMEHLWERHFWDSAQLAPLVRKDAKTLADLGSGAGFPGLVLAILLRDREGFRATLFEATAKKARFLAEMATELALPVDIANMRIEDRKLQPFDLITARGVAPLDKLLPYAQRFWGPDSSALFLKGQNVAAELTQAHKSWRMKVVKHVSQSDPSGCILEIRKLKYH